jgi:hypothetical protein
MFEGVQIWTKFSSTSVPQEEIRALLGDLVAQLNALKERGIDELARRSFLCVLLPVVGKSIG